VYVFVFGEWCVDVFCGGECGYCVVVGWSWGVVGGCCVVWVGGGGVGGEISPFKGP